MEFSGKGSWADAPPHQTALARRVVEAVKHAAVLERLSTGAAEWMKTADREAQRLGKEIRQANRKANKQRGNVGNAGRRPGEDAQGNIEFPVPLPDQATDAENCAVLAAIHDHFPGDLKLGPKSQRLRLGPKSKQAFLLPPTSHEILTWQHVTKLDEDGTRRLNGFLEGLIAKLVTAGGSPKAAKRGGRKKVDYETELREAKILEDWKRARDTGVYKADFAKQLGMPAKALEKLLGRASRRKSRANK